MKIPGEYSPALHPVQKIKYLLVEIEQIAGKENQEDAARARYRRIFLMMLYLRLLLLVFKLRCLLMFK